MITKTAVQYASVGLVKEAFNFKPIMGGLKTGLGKVKNFFGNMFGGGAQPAAATNTLGSFRRGRLQGMKNMATRAKNVRNANSVPKTTPTPTTTHAPTTTPTPGQVNTPMPNQTTTPMPGTPNATPQFTQEQMNAAKNSNLLGGAVIGAGALGGINYVGNRVFAQPQRQPMMPMMMPMPMY